PAVARMLEAYFCRRHGPAGELAAYSGEAHHRKLDLMLVRTPRHADVVQFHSQTASGPELERDTLIDDGTVSLNPLKRLAHRFARCLCVIEQTDHAKVVGLREAESEKLVLQRRCNEVEKLDLTLHIEARTRVGDLLGRQARLPQ